jgi:hypothetical protein
MSDVQTMHGNPPDSESDPASQDAAGMDNNEPATENDNTETETTRKRRRFRPDEIALAQRFIAKAKPGEPIPFTSLDRDMKQAVLPNKRTRLMDRGILEVDYDEDDGLIKTVTVNPEILKDYEWDLTPVVPVVKPPVTKEPGEYRQRKPRNQLADSKYRIRKLHATNPRRVGSHGYYNWNLCYEDGQTIPEYLSKMDYDRMVVTSNGTYFNGPSTLFIEQDLKAKYIGVYDSTLPFTNEDGSANEAIWVDWRELDRTPNTDAEQEEAPDSAESAESDTTQEAAESVPEPTPAQG